MALPLQSSLTSFPPTASMHAHAMRGSHHLIWLLSSSIAITFL